MRSACADDTGNVITKSTKASRCWDVMGDFRGLDLILGAIAPSIPHLEPPLSENDLKLADQVLKRKMIRPTILMLSMLMTLCS